MSRDPISSKPPQDSRLDAGVDAWDEEELEDEPVLQTNETTALIGSMLVHLTIILALALVQLSNSEDEEAVVIVATPPTHEQDLETIDVVTYSPVAAETVGANSESFTDVAQASAEVFDEVSEIPDPVDMEPTDLGQIAVNNIFSQPTAPMDRLTNQKGQVGRSETGAAGAVDRLTQEILQSLEERPTLVVWLFDQSGSLHRQRREIRDRFDRIYEELGIVRKARESKNPKGTTKTNHDAALLTSIIGFGNDVKLYTENPTEDVEEIKSIVDNIQVDSTGVERVFTAISSAADQYMSFRRSRGGKGPQRNVMFVVVTDERGDDEIQLEKSIQGCRRWGIPVYVIGVPAPFGRASTLVKYVDPDPKYDQSPKWAQVDQGPETFRPERVNIGFSGNFEKEPVIDSGFGPYSLTRLCYETGGIYFTVHPNRNVNRKVNRGEVDAYASDLQYFFDPIIMQRYRPDYLSQADYMNKVKASPLRQSLVRAALMSPAKGVNKVKTRFVQVDIARLAGELTEAQQAVAVLERPLAMMKSALEPGMKFRDSEESVRWRAGYDLAMGRVLAQKVRTETYNAMLAEAKRGGMKFKGEKSNTWVLKPSDDVTVGSKWKREAEAAVELLSTVANEHKGTPWALLAQKELEVPIGWKWEEDFTDMTPRKRRPGNGGNNNNTPSDDKKRMLKKAPKRPVPKL